MPTRMTLGCFLLSVAGLLAAECFSGSAGRSEIVLQERDLDLWIGQMLMVGFRGLEVGPGDEIARQIQEFHLGGVILFDFDVPSRTAVRNISSPDQLRRLTASLQKLGPPPLLIGIDQEGGRIARLKPEQGFPGTLSSAELGKCDNEAVTRNQAATMGRLLREIGVNLNFAPVVDVAVNPENPAIVKLERSYSADPEVVVRHARWTIEELHREGILVAIKHFPGHGSSRDDSHRGLPDVTGSWSRRELVPFERLVKEGLADCVMTAHIFNANWDRTHPATLSQRTITGILREQLNFEGVVVSDDMGMGAIVKRYSFEKALELSINAGVDLLVLGNNAEYDPEIGPRAHRTIKGLVTRGTVSPEKIRASYDRIVALKRRLR